MLPKDVFWKCNPLFKSTIIDISIIANLACTKFKFEIVGCVYVEFNEDEIDGNDKDDDEGSDKDKNDDMHFDEDGDLDIERKSFKCKEIIVCKFCDCTYNAEILMMSALHNCIYINIFIYVNKLQWKLEMKIIFTKSSLVFYLGHTQLHMSN